MITSLAGEEAQVVSFLVAVRILVQPQSHRGFSFGRLRNFARIWVPILLPDLSGFER
jgi:hypothetical protein